VSLRNSDFLFYVSLTDDAVIGSLSPDPDVFRLTGAETDTSESLELDVFVLLFRSFPYVVYHHPPVTTSMRPKGS